MTDSTAIKHRLRGFIDDTFLYMRPDLTFGDDDSLFTKGVIDSLGVMEIVGFIEEEYALQVDPADLTEQNFGSLGALSDYVARRALAESSAA